MSPKTFLFLMQTSTIQKVITTSLKDFFETTKINNKSISATLSRINTIYILIPILLIPQLILGGIIVNFDKMNPLVAKHGKVPFVGDLMASRWAFEAASLIQFRENAYNKNFFHYEKELSNANFKLLYWIPEMENLIENLHHSMQKEEAGKGKQWVASTPSFQTLLHEITKENRHNRNRKFDETKLYAQNLNSSTTNELKNYLESIEHDYHKIQKFYENKREEMNHQLLGRFGKEGLITLKKKTIPFIQ
jgi:hypothetical protein